MSLRLAVFENREILFREIGHELARVVARDHVGGDECDAGAEGRLSLRNQQGRALRLRQGKQGEGKRNRPRRGFHGHAQYNVCDEADTPPDSGRPCRRGRRHIGGPGEVLAGLVADVPCGAVGPAGELLGTLPLFRNRVVPGQFGVKYDGVGLDARLDTDLSLLEPNQLITPNELAYIRTEIPAAAANHQGPWTLDASGLLATPTVLKLDDLASLSTKMGPHLFECSGQRQQSALRPDERGRMGGHPTDRRRRAAEAVEGRDRVLVSGYDHIGQNSPRSIVGASWVFPLA